MRHFVQLSNGDLIHVDAIGAIRAPEPTPESGFYIAVDYRIGEFVNCVKVHYDSQARRDAALDAIRLQIERIEEEEKAVRS